MAPRFLAFLVVLAGVAFATPAFPHATLVASEPATGAVLADPPATVTLSFNETVQPTAARLITATGETIELAPPTAVGADVTITLPENPGDGTHVLSWRVVSSDGHPIGGTVVFSVGSVTGPGAEIAASEPGVRPAIWLARVLIYLGLFIGAAGTFFVAWVAAPAPLPARPARIMRVVMIVGMVAVPVAFALQGVDLVGGGLGDLLDASALSNAASSTYLQTLVVAFLALAAGLAALALPHRARLFSLLALLGIGLAFSLSGHASRAPPEALSWLVVFLHTAAVGFWAGALLPLLFYLRGKGRESTAVLGRFSAVIPHALLPLVVAGTLLVLIQVDGPADIVDTAYGRLLAVKLALVLALFGLAVVNRYRLTPLVRSRPAEGARRLRRSVVAELAVILVVFGVVAGWRFTPPPRSINAAAAAAAAAAAPRIPPDFSGHFHVADFGAFVTVSPGAIGNVRVATELLTQEGLPLEAMEVEIALAYPEQGIEPIAVDAVKDAGGIWRAEGFFLPLAGDWTITVTALISDFDRRTVSGPVAIADPNASPEGRP